MFTLIGWQEAQTNTTVLTNLLGIADPTAHVEGDYIYVPRGMNQIIWAYACGDTLLNMRLNSPSLRALFPHYVHPVNNFGAYEAGVAEAQYDRFPHVQDLRDNPLPLVQGEGLECEETKGHATSLMMNLVLALADAPPAPVKGKIHTVFFTVDITTVFREWTSGAITLAETLPAGQYAIVGAAMWGFTLLAFRFILPGQAWRPGAPGMYDRMVAVPDWMRNGRMGEWGRFHHDVPPTVELVGVTEIDQEADGYIDLIKVA